MTGPLGWTRRMPAVHVITRCCSWQSLGICDQKLSCGVKQVHSRALVDYTERRAAEVSFSNWGTGKKNFPDSSIGRKHARIVVHLIDNVKVSLARTFGVPYTTPAAAVLLWCHYLCTLDAYCRKSVARVTTRPAS